ncbi:hypothetical protein DPMN_076735 [Dreissena polymorpha]|uniref:Uncharacterized protein n=1 Tax=Dreissena polymorpha TaxID=45954 RepID=A0A9D3YNL8_DREPO|nr:hypothetical protein DPMN_076735 [Dreissena polymorpha]
MTVDNTALISMDPIFETDMGNASRFHFKQIPEAQNSNSYDQYETFYLRARFITGLVFYPIVCVFGITGNIMSIIVMSQHTPTGNKAYGFLYPYAHYVFNASLCISAWLIVSVAVERYVNSFKQTAQTQMRRRSMRRLFWVYAGVIMREDGVEKLGTPQFATLRGNTFLGSPYEQYRHGIERTWGTWSYRVNDTVVDIDMFYDILSEEDALKFPPTTSRDRVSDATQSKIDIVVVELVVVWQQICRDMSPGSCGSYDDKEQRQFDGLSHSYKLDQFISKNNHNGTYSGESELVAMLEYTREAISAIYRVRRKNSGMPWFCGKPINKNLLCEDWHLTYASNGMPLIATAVELNLLTM